LNRLNYRTTIEISMKFLTFLWESGFHRNLMQLMQLVQLMQLMQLMQ